MAITNADLDRILFAYLSRRVPKLFEESDEMYRAIAGYHLYLPDGSLHRFGSRPVEKVSTRSARIPLRITPNESRSSQD